MPLRVTTSRTHPPLRHTVWDAQPAKGLVRRAVRAQTRRQAHLRLLRSHSKKRRRRQRRLTLRCVHYNHHHHHHPRYACWKHTRSTIRLKHRGETTRVRQHAVAGRPPRLARRRNSTQRQPLRPRPPRPQHRLLPSTRGRRRRLRAVLRFQHAAMQSPPLPPPHCASARAAAPRQPRARATGERKKRSCHRTAQALTRNERARPGAHPPSRRTMQSTQIQSAGSGTLESARRD